MKVKTVELHFNKSEDGVQITDITRPIEHSVVDSHIIDGIAIVHVSCPQTSISTMEYEPGSIKDMKDAIQRLIPTNGNGNGFGRHNRIYDYSLGGVGTAVSYIERNRKTREGEPVSEQDKVMHAILGPSITIPVKDNRIMTGMWQKIVLLDFSKDAAQKKVTLQIVGEFEQGN